MANIIKQYSKVTRAAKKTASAATKASSNNPDEQRIFATFKKRAREDFKTLKPIRKKRA